MAGASVATIFPLADHLPAHRRVPVHVPQHPSSAVLAMWQSKPASDADFPGGTWHAGISRIALPTVRSTGCPSMLPLYRSGASDEVLRRMFALRYDRAEFTLRRFIRAPRSRAAEFGTGHRGRGL